MNGFEYELKMIWVQIQIQRITKYNWELKTQIQSTLLKICFNQIKNEQNLIQ